MATITSGDQQRICHSDNTWTGLVPTVTCNSEFLQYLQLTRCVSYVLLTVVTCLPLTNPENGEVVTFNNNNYQSSATYSCNAGYVLTPSDGGVRVCGEDGEWTGVAPTCLRKLEIES